MAKYAIKPAKQKEDAMQRKLRKDKALKKARKLVNKDKKKRHMPKIGKL
jgi:hypothetical protein